jgi:hypothetical protein
MGWLKKVEGALALCQATLEGTSEIPAKVSMDLATQFHEPKIG